MADDNLEHRLQLMARDSSLPAELVASFGRWIRSAEDDELFRVPVISWAERHAVPRDQAIDLFLHATRVGILEMTWGVICPLCGLHITTPGGLRALGPDPHCRLCRFDFSAALDDQVEVIFSVEPAIRKLRFYDPSRFNPITDTLSTFFTPSLEPQEVQRQIAASVRNAVLVPPNDRAVLRFEAVADHMYATMAVNVHALTFLQTVPDGPTTLTVEAHDGGMIPPTAAVGPGPIAMTIVNRTNWTLTVAQMDLGTHEDQEAKQMPPAHRLRPFLTGKEVLTSQTFRDLFRGERVGDTGLRIKNLAVVFTDLEASTQLYERVGDLRALALVREHFDRLGEVVARQRGAVVKTIGDAVMAAFAEPERAVAAAAGMIRAARKIDADGKSLAIKVGVHSGSCIAIQTNHQIDYFGSAVNIASRVQALAAGHEIVVTDVIWDAPGVRGLADDYGLHERADKVDLRGIATGVGVHRLT